MSFSTLIRWRNLHNRRKDLRVGFGLPAALSQTLPTVSYSSYILRKIIFCTISRISASERIRLERFAVSITGFPISGELGWPWASR